MILRVIKNSRSSLFIIVIVITCSIIAGLILFRGPKIRVVYQPKTSADCAYPISGSTCPSTEKAVKNTQSQTLTNLPSLYGEFDWQETDKEEQFLCNAVEIYRKLEFEPESIKIKGKQYTARTESPSIIDDKQLLNPYVKYYQEELIKIDWGHKITFNGEKNFPVVTGINFDGHGGSCYSFIGYKEGNIRVITLGLFLGANEKIQQIFPGSKSNYYVTFLSNLIPVKQILKK